MERQKRADRCLYAAKLPGETRRLQMFSVCVRPNWIHRVSSAVSHVLMAYIQLIYLKLFETFFIVWIMYWFVFFNVYFLTGWSDSWTSVKRKFTFFKADWDIEVKDGFHLHVLADYLYAYKMHFPVKTKSCNTILLYCLIICRNLMAQSAPALRNIRSLFLNIYFYFIFFPPFEFCRFS